MGEKHHNDDKAQADPAAFVADLKAAHMREQRLREAEQKAQAKPPPPIDLLEKLANPEKPYLKKSPRLQIVNGGDRAPPTEGSEGLEGRSGNRNRRAGGAEGGGTGNRN